MSKMSKMSKVNPFLVAKKVLVKRGWCKGNRHDTDGRSCLIGAFEHNAGISVYRFFKNDCNESIILKKIIVKKFSDRLGIDSYNGNENVRKEDEPISVIACFNNHDKTTLSDVNNILDIAAKLYK